MMKKILAALLTVVLLLAAVHQFSSMQNTGKWLTERSIPAAEILNCGFDCDALRVFSFMGTCHGDESP